MTFRWIGLLLLAAVLVAPLGAKAQNANPQPAAASSEHPKLTAEALDALVAPIALYPDQLLSQVLMASTYPLEVVQAERFIEANKNLKGDALEAAAAKESWDDSVKSLTATPSVLAMMSSKIDWMDKLGDAVIAQEPDVMDAIQRLRAKAQANNKLATTKEQTVTVRQVNNRQIIAIEPTDPGTVYVPYYNPAVVYGGWPYPAYPPYYFPPPGYIAAGIIATGLAFGAGYALGRWASGGYWGGSMNWNNNNINIGGGGNWQHRPGGGGGRGNHVSHHRGQGGRGLNFRGNNGNQVLRPGNGRGNLGNRNGVSTRPSNRPHAGHHRASGGARNRPSVGHRAGNRAGNLGSRGGSVRHRVGGGGGGIRHRAAGGGGLRGHGGGGLRGGGGHRGGGAHRGGGGGHRGGGGGRGGGRRSDIRLKHDIWFVGRTANGLDLYHFIYNGGHKAYVGVMAQEVQQVMPQAVDRGADGYLRVHYETIGVKFESYDHWLKDSEQQPATAGWQ
jgi:Protein of unknown function (DUF3300)/Chaperone of endosialidase